MSLETQQAGTYGKNKDPDQRLIGNDQLQAILTHVGHNGVRVVERLPSGGQHFTSKADLQHALGQKIGEIEKSGIKDWRIVHSHEQEYARYSTPKQRNLKAALATAESTEEATKVFTKRVVPGDVELFVKALKTAKARNFAEDYVYKIYEQHGGKWEVCPPLFMSALKEAIPAPTGKAAMDMDASEYITHFGLEGDRAVFAQKWVEWKKRNFADTMKKNPANGGATKAQATLKPKVSP